MADASVVHIGENSQEEVALKLFRTIMNCESKDSNNMDRAYVLDTYSECLQAVKYLRDVKSR